MSEQAQTCAMRACTSACSAPTARPSTTEEREDTLAGLRSAHGFLQGRIAQRAAPEAHARARVRLRRHDRPRDAPRGADRRESRMSGSTGLLPPSASWCSSGCARTRASCSPPTSTPTATRSARSSRCRGSSPRSASDSEMFIARATCRCRASTACSRSTGLISEPPADIAAPDGRVPRLRQHRPQLGQRAARRRPPAQHRPPPRQHRLRHAQPVVDPQASCTAEIVWC